MFRPVSIVAVVLLLGTAVHAQDRTREIDETFGWATRATPGCTVAVSQHGKVVVRFRRDDTGKVVDFDYSNPLLRNVRFRRASDSGC